jgi:hypothetical protein
MRSLGGTCKWCDVMKRTKIWRGITIEAFTSRLVTVASMVINPVMVTRKTRGLVTLLCR